MKNILFFIGAGLLTLVALGSVGHIVFLGLGIALLYWSFRSFLKADSVLSKIGWSLLGVVSFMLILGNVPGLVGIGAVLLLFLLYRKWKTNKKQEKEYHSYHHFDEEWDKIMAKK